MEMYFISLGEAAEIYNTHMKKDFPPDELRPFFSIEGLYNSGAYKCVGFFDGEKLAAYAFFAVSDKVALLDYFAVCEDMRSAGVGTAFFKKLKAAPDFLDAAYIIIEVESIASAFNEKETLTRTRRISFYKSCGCLMSEVSSVLFGVEYSIMYLGFSGGQIPGETLAKELSAFYHMMVCGLIGSAEEYHKVARVFFRAATF